MGAVPRRARIQGSWIVVSLNSRLASNKKEEDDDPDEDEIGRDEPLETRDESSATRDNGSVGRDEGLVGLTLLLPMWGAIM